MDFFPHQKYWNISKQTFHVASKQPLQNGFEESVRNQREEIWFSISFFQGKICLKNKKMKFFFSSSTTNFYFRLLLFSTFPLKKRYKWVERKGENIMNTMWKIVSFAFLQNVFKEHFQRKCNGIIFFWLAVSLNWGWSVEFFVWKLQELIKITLPNTACESCTFHPSNFSVLLATCYVRLCVYEKFLTWYTLAKFI